MKSFIIVCICLCAIIAVFGLNDRLNYDDFKFAFESVRGDAELILSDLTSIEVLAFCIENFNPQARIRIAAVEEIDHTSWGISYIIIRDDGTSLARYWFGLTQDTAEKLEKLLQPLTWGFGTYTGLFTDAVSALNAVVFFLGALVTIILVLVAIIFDIAVSVFSLVRAFLYLVGLSSSI